MPCEGIGLDASDKVFRRGAESQALYVCAGIGLKFYHSRAHGEYRYSTTNEKDLTWSRLAIPWLRRTPLASRGAMFDVVGLWLLYGTGEHSVVFCKASGSLLSLTGVRT